MYTQLLSVLLLAGAVLAERPFINEPDTGLILPTILGTLPTLTDMVAVADFEAAARHYMPTRNYCKPPRAFAASPT